jgi:hypothetical protein
LKTKKKLFCHIYLLPIFLDKETMFLIPHLFFSWKYNTENKEIGEYTFISKKNENLKGKINFNEENMNYIEINNADNLKKSIIIILDL